MGVRTRQTPGPEFRGNGEDEPSRDQVFHVLRNRRRRYAIHHLKRADGPVDVGELATQVAAWENDVSVAAVTSRQRRRVYNALQQTHLPELDETGLVDVERRDVALTERGERLDVYLEVVPDRAVPWSQYYLALGGLGLAMIAGAWANVGPLGDVSDVGVGVVLAIALLVSAGANVYSQHAARLGRHDKPPELREG